MPVYRLTGLLLLLVSLSATAEAPNMNADPTLLTWPDYRGGVFQAGDLFLAGQPLTEKAIAQMKSTGITTIVNLRTPGEMKNRQSTPIDEATLARQLDLDYHHLPSGGPDYPYTPTTLERFASILEAAPGKVMLHCNSGKRAAHLWVAYLVKYEGLPIEQAVKLGQKANFGQVALEGFLAEPMQYRHLSKPN